MSIDTSNLESEGYALDVDAAREYLKDFDEKQQTEKIKQSAAVESDTQAAAIKEDPRDADKWGLKAVAEEFKSIGVGGVQDTVSSMMTFPERTVDAFSGEMQRERAEKGYYRPEWDPLVDNENPIITKTWWGKLLRGTVHFGTMAAAIIPAAKVTAARLGIAAT